MNLTRKTISLQATLPNLTSRLPLLTLDREALLPVNQRRLMMEVMEQRMPRSPSTVPREGMEVLLDMSSSHRKLARTTMGALSLLTARRR